MINKLRKRVIIYTVSAVALVLFLLMGIVNGVNFFSRNSAADNMLEFLAENGGTFPGKHGDGFDSVGEQPQGTEELDDWEKGELKDDFLGGKPGKKGRGMTEETPYETRFFTVDLKTDGSISSVNTGRIAAVNSEKAVEMAEKVAASGKSKGYQGNYKYLVADIDDGRRYIFMDCTRDLMAVKDFLKTSILVSLIGLLGIAGLVTILSPRMIKPIAESHAKQKEFITNAGHELKTPMTVISSCTEVLEMETGENKWTKGIKEQIDKLADLTTHMVALAKMDEGEEMPVEDVDLSKLVEDALQGFKLDAETQGRVIETSIEEGISVKGNPTLLRELISILADNALKYGKESEPIIFALEKKGKAVMLREENFADDIEKGDHKEFFERFYRGDTSHSSEKPGSGIGLSMAESIVTAHGGEIKAESPDGERLVMTVML